MIHQETCAKSPFHRNDIPAPVDSPSRIKLWALLHHLRPPSCRSPADAHSALVRPRQTYQPKWSSLVHKCDASTNAMSCGGYPHNTQARRGVPPDRRTTFTCWDKIRFELLAKHTRSLGCVTDFAALTLLYFVVDHVDQEPSCVGSQALLLF